MGLASLRFAARALISFADRDTPVSLSLVVGPLLRGSKSVAALPIKKPPFRTAFLIGAGNGIRTHDINLGKVALYP